MYTLIGPGDHVICVYPTYQQLYDTPRSLGAEVTLWTLKKDNGWVPDVDELSGLIKPNTKMIIINNPNSPTGAPIPDNVIATIATGSMSKGCALAGIRVGWVASRDKSIISAIMLARDYTTISVSQIDDQIARFALSPEVKPTLGIHDSPPVSVFMGRAGTTAFIRFNDKNGDPVNDVKLCLDLLDKAKLLFVAGSRCFGGDEDFKGYVRMGYVCETEVLVDGLKELEACIDKYLV
ncbi:hypothetical protein ACHAQD_012213 [Fusarium lateritium]